MRFVKALRKRWVTRDYARKLPKMLAKDYGFSRSYTPGQVKSTIERYGLNNHYSGYAISMFSDRPACEHYYRGLGETWNYDAVRAEVAAVLFDGNPHFTLLDIIEAFPNSDPIASVGEGHGATGGHSHDSGSGFHGH